MTEPDPEFDATHPSGHLLFRSCRGGYLHSVALAEGAMGADAEGLARAVLVTAGVSYLRAVLQVRADLVAAGHTPSADVPTARDLQAAEEMLAGHRLDQADPTRPG